MITKEEYIHRRKQLAARLPDDAIALLPSASEMLRNGDAHYRFRQDSDLYYLTGFEEPESLLVVTGGKNSLSFLFNRSKNPEREQWTGHRLGQEAAREQLGVEEAWSIDALEEKLPELLADKSAIYYPLGRYSETDKLVKNALQTVKQRVRRGVKAPNSLHDLTPLVGEMRLLKSESEIELMRRAAKISTAGHRRAMQYCMQLAWEYQLEAELLYEFSRQGCRSVAYDPIVGGGANACILHYTENSSALKKGELVLIDAGGEYQGYASDITRTFPVNGCFNEEQRIIYDLVLKAQKRGIETIRPGERWNKAQEVIIDTLTDGLIELGLLKGNKAELIEAAAYKPFYMHNSGHWLGLDVHDSGAYKIEGKWRTLEPGMVLTVEPGLYISAGMEGVDERWWDIAVRIEDDILVTKNGYENLTKDAPVEIEEIEALMRE